MPEYEKQANKTVKVRASTHTALKRCATGNLTMDDVIRDALRDYDPPRPDHTEPLEEA